eukprot:TRINITY_DN3209_c1_g13_i1.p1 TRINITY_DN3209_c1_g13~~TRINITY_DN3209_c1_g13_i1.p1  ORF type:complete len:180 (+),score=62.94 TRINITY_DN3209_c1_g13_i1:42-542(+)
MAELKNNLNNDESINGNDNDNDTNFIPTNNTDLPFLPQDLLPMRPPPLALVKQAFFLVTIPILLYFLSTKVFFKTIRNKLQRTLVGTVFALIGINVVVWRSVYKLWKEEKKWKEFNETITNTIQPIVDENYKMNNEMDDAIEEEKVEDESENQSKKETDSKSKKND